MRGVKLSVVIPAHNEAGSIERDDRGPRRPPSSGEAIDYEVLVVDDSSTDGTAAVVEQIAAVEPAGPLHRPRTTRAASASRSAAGLERFEGDAVAIVMADGSDSPADLRRLPPAARGGLRLRLRLALRHGAQVHDYPR